MSSVAFDSVHPEQWQGFHSIMPAISTHLKICFRRLPAEQREEKTQEALASALVSYRSLATSGRMADIHPGTLAGFAVKHVNNRRHVGGSQDGARDAMSTVAQNRGCFRTMSTDRYRRETGEWEQITVEDRRVPVPDLVSFRIDFREWLDTLSRRDRKIIASFIRGDSTSGVAQQFGISEGRVSQLRRKYQVLWRAFQRQAIRLAA